MRCDEMRFEHELDSAAHKKWVQLNQWQHTIYTSIWPFIASVNGQQHGVWSVQLNLTAAQAIFIHTLLTAIMSWTIIIVIIIIIQ